LGRSKPGSARWQGGGEQHGPCRLLASGRVDGGALPVFKNWWPLNGAAAHENTVIVSLRWWLAAAALLGRRG